MVRWVGEVSSRERLQEMSEMTETSGKMRRGSIYESVPPFRHEVRSRDSAGAKAPRRQSSLTV